jgi:hypothetical protein
VVAKRTPQKKTYRWHISRIRKEGGHLGVIEGPDEATAVKEAIERYGVIERW